MLPVLMSIPVATDYPVKPIPFPQVHLADKFWAPRIEINRTVTIPYAFAQCEKTGRMDLFKRAAQVLKGDSQVDKTPPGYPFDDSDVYKVLEGAAYALSVKKDEKLQAYVRNLVELIASAQEPDGYLYCTRTINPAAPHAWSGKERWEKEEDNSHELYNLGHLYEAAAAHFQATGSKTLLDVATKSADLLVKTFLVPKRKIWPGHQVIEIGLVKLYRLTGKSEYLDLAKFFLDCRGGGGEYWQAHKPVIEQTEAVGHAVRATYMYSGMADVAALLGDRKYLAAIDRIWTDVVDSKLYVTGGIGSSHEGEAFGKPYDLPNLTAYCETCAQIGNAYWNHRLFLLHGQAKYMDVLERTLYNGLISGVSLDGTTFFYPNPLESEGKDERSPWFGCACCPANVTRFMASVPGYFYAQSKDSLYVNLYAAGTAKMKLDSGPDVEITQETNYPWDGAITLRIKPAQSAKFKLHVRIPGWARNEAVPSKLYAFEGSAPAPTLKVNGKQVELSLVDGYAVIDREWHAGDSVSLDLPMPVRKVVAKDQVVMDRGRVAIQRGPVVFCAEGVDQAGSVLSMMLDEKAAFEPVNRPDLLGGVVTLKTSGFDLKSADGSVTKTTRPITLIPYATWANRGRSEMLVWLPVRLDAARPARPIDTDR